MARRPTRRRPPKTPLMQRLRGDFLTGLVVVLPVFLTIYVIWGLVGLVDSRVIPLIPRQYNPENVFGRNIFGLGLLVFLIFTTLVGALTKGYVGARVIRLGESMVERMPVVRSIYNATKQIAETVFSQSSPSFQQACLVEYPRKGLWAVAFISTATRGEIASKAGDADMLSVFLPTTPNPTSGFLLFVPRADVVMLDMSVEEAAKLIISAGLVTPEPSPPAPAGRPSARRASGRPVRPRPSPPRRRRADQRGRRRAKRKEAAGALTNETPKGRAIRPPRARGPG